MEALKQHKEVQVLEQFVCQEEKKLISSCPFDNNDKKAILYSLLRGLDVFYLFARDKNKCIHHYEYGWFKAISLIYGNYVNEEGYPLFRAEEKTLGFAHWLVLRSGEIGFSKKIIDFIKAGLGNVSIHDKQITVTFRDIGAKEEFDKHTFDWVHDLFEKNVCEPEIEKIKKDIENVRKKMHSLVDKWRNYYIQYDTTPEIDNVFEKLAYYYLLPCEEKEEFGKNALFGGIPYSKYCEFITVVCGIALKHYYFCLELFEKYREEISLPDIITITKDRKGFIESMAKYLEVNITESEQMLDSITLSPENIEYHSLRPRAIPPPYVKIADNTLVRSIVGCQANPYNFLNYELRRRFEKDYFCVVNEREKIFRNQLYGLFQEDNYIKVNKVISFKSSKGDSDIDAAIFDKNYEVLGLFQLKWQEMYGASMKERKSRISNLYPETVKWIDKVEAWVNESDANNVLEKFGFVCKKLPLKVLLFVICRHGTFFTGHEPDKRAAWASAWLILKMFLRLPDGIPNKLEVLHSLLHQEYSAISSVKSDLEGDTFKIGEYEFNLKIIQDD